MAARAKADDRWNGFDVDTLVFWSFRYFLGRCTISTCCFASDLAKAWPALKQRTRANIRRELEAAFREDDRERQRDKNSGKAPRRMGYPLGWDCDRDAWDKVRQAWMKEVER